MSDILEGIRIVDTDTHWSEPHDLWTSRAPAGYAELVPHVKRVEGKEIWLVNGDVFIGVASPASVVRRDAVKSHGVEFFRWSIDEVHEASYDLGARLAMMDRLGIWAQIVYPNVAGFGNQRFLAIDKPELRNLCVELYNDAMAELQEASEERIFPMALVPWWDVPAAVKEIERAHDLGLRGVVTCSDPDTAGLPDLGQSAWDPFWQVCSDLSMPINFHIAASDTGWNMLGRAPWKSFGPAARLAIGSANLFLDNARVIGNLLYSGVPERFPACRFVSVESGIGWIPFFLEALDYQATELAPDETAHLRLRPSEYFRRQVYASFWFETVAPQRLLEAIGVRNVLFETDFPHPTCLYPESLAHVRKVMADLDPDTRRRVLQDNAAELYRIPLPA